MIAALEYALVNFGSVATLVATTRDQDFVSPPAWYDWDAEAAHVAGASRVLIRSKEPPPQFAANIAIQYFRFDTGDAIRLGDLDTALDIAALPESTPLAHHVDVDGYLCRDEGTYTSNGLALRVLRVQAAFSTPMDGKSALSIFTATTTSDTWYDIEQEILEMEKHWLARTIHNSGGN
ncbi:hypothetical protein [Gordonia amicalis]|uniref:hypothetical protein n=1 Tax=Gordonia amicalis TaxID=89053 RepID=UPI0002A63C41|nr:hypothetical protein [Gordonia amicalis]MBA5848092.1 acetyltransferase [Gordonia amicalis]MDV7172593.1 acetyltransferase [Gordonia amicalis]NKX76180.1 acetyltransferase [Gordonia amicalis]UKO92205.1 acetyltransferase [Gordonia amicalis]UOG19963.1 acetyltransferase [Gordonia amicalis]